MDLDDQETRELWHAHLAGLFSGRKVIAGVVPLAALTDLVSILARCGAEKPLLVHAELGAGPIPSEEESGRVEVRLPAYKTMTEEVREHDRVLRSLPSSVRDAIDRAIGTFAKLDVGDALVAGQRVGPLNAAMMRFLDEELGAGFGPVEPAADVRPSHHQQGDHDHGDVRDDLTDADLLG